MVGRTDERSAIVDRLHIGVGKVIVGAAGLGKTVLACEVQRRMNLEGWHTHMVLCGSGLDFPLYALPKVADGEGRTYWWSMTLICSTKIPPRPCGVT